MLVVGDLNALNDEAKWDRLDAIHEENGWAPPEDSTVPGGALHTFLENGWVDVSRGAGLSSPAKDPSAASTTSWRTGPLLSSGRGRTRRPTGGPPAGRCRGRGAGLI